MIDLLIVGGGPVGLTAAIEAQRLGLSCRIIERKEKRRTNDSRALILHPRMVELLSAHPDLIKSIEENSKVIPAVNMELIEEKTTLTIDAEEQRFGDTSHPHLYSLAQYQTEMCLENEVKRGGCNVEYGTAFESLTQGPDGAVTVKAKNCNGGEEVITAKYVLGADGGRSAVRDAIGIALDRIDSYVSFIAADIRILPGSPEKKMPGIHLMWTKEGPIALFPVGACDYCRLFMQAPDGVTKENTVLDEIFFEKRLLEMTGKKFDIEVAGWQNVFNITHGASDAYFKGCVFLAGDAAHVHSPVGGQGMNYGIWDAITLVSKIAWAERVLAMNPGASETAKDILASYETERHSMGLELVRTVKLATSVAITRNPVIQSVRNFVLKTAIPFAKYDAQRRVGQLELAYKPEYSRYILPIPTLSSWLNNKSFICQPGQRLPNLILDDGTSLYDKIDRERHTWICANVPNGNSGTSGNVIHISPATVQKSIPIISEGALSSAQTILARPDLYVAAVELGSDSFHKLQGAVRGEFGGDCFDSM